MKRRQNEVNGSDIHTYEAAMETIGSIVWYILEASSGPYLPSTLNNIKYIILAKGVLSLWSDMVSISVSNFLPFSELR